MRLAACGTRRVSFHRIWALTLAAISVTCALPLGVKAQTAGSTVITGQVDDFMGAWVPKAAITAVNRETGSSFSTRTNAWGRFELPPLPPGSYTIKVDAAGYAIEQSGEVVAASGASPPLHFVLQLAQARESVAVSGEVPLLNLANPNLSTTLNMRTLAELPDAGGDLSVPAQFVPGAIVNTAGVGSDFVGGGMAYGSLEFNGLPATANGFIVDGLEANDPFTNLNSGLATNLLLGMNSIAEVTIDTMAYSVDEGRYGAAQIHYITKSGTNQLHGDLYELWNGSALNAKDAFLNSASNTAKPRSVLNHFGGSLGGPLIRDQLFFFIDSEWLRLAMPVFSNATVPSAAFQEYVLQQLPLGGTDAVTGSHYAAAPQMLPFYQRLFSLYGNTGGTPLAVLGCPFNSDGSAATDGNGCAKRRGVARTSEQHEQAQILRVDYDLNTDNILWFRFQADNGQQTAWTDSINSAFDAVSSQPLYSFAAGYTHILSQNLVNYFNPAFSWYSSRFAPRDAALAMAALPIVLQGGGANAPFTTLGGLDNDWPQGRRATRVFLNDNLAWSRGNHELRFGTNLRIFRLNDFDFGQGTVPLVTYTSLPEFIYGVASTATQSFPLTANEPFNFVNLDFYVQDTWKVNSRLSWSIGLRNSFNSNPLNPHERIARLPGDFSSLAHDVNQSLHAVLQTGMSHLFSTTPLAVLQPRTAIAWQMTPTSMLRTGFGVFGDILPGSVADIAGRNPPYVRTFQGGLLGTAGGSALAPGVPNSAVDALAAANQNFASGFASGQLSCVSPLAAAESCIAPVAITVVPGGTLHTPYYMEWSLGVEHQIGIATSVKAQYIGTRGVHQPYLSQANGYQTVCPGCFAPFPYGQPVDARFGAVTQFSTGANSNYNGLQLSASKRMGRGLQGQINYTWSHCLDEVSNGGLLPFSSASILEPLPGNLRRDYGPCDYDIRHNLSGQYVYELPLKTQNALLGHVVNGWQVSGTLIWHSALPFSVLSTPYTANGRGLLQAGGPQFATLVSGADPYCRHCTIAGVTQAGTIQWLNPNAFVSTVDPSTGACYGGDTAANCQFGSTGRNQFRGPGFFWNDFYLTKWFSLTERTKLRVEAQFFNLFNHPNYGLPSLVNAGISGRPFTQTGFGALTDTASPPTGLLGVGGGDSSPRMISFQARVEF